MPAGWLFRVQRILFKTGEEWRETKRETLSVSRLFFSYVLVVAAVSPLFRFFSSLIYGKFKRPYSGWSWSIFGRELLFCVLAYLFSLLAAYLWGRLIDVSAPLFSSPKSRERAMALSVYSLTPYWIGGLLYLVPHAGWWLKALSGVFGFYVLHSGLAGGMMETPRRKVVGYFALSGLLALLLVGGTEVILRALFAIEGLVRF